MSRRVTITACAHTVSSQHDTIHSLHTLFANAPRLSVGRADVTGQQTGEEVWEEMVGGNHKHSSTLHTLHKLTYIHEHLHRSEVDNLHACYTDTN